MMEKYGAEVERYEVVEVVAFKPEDKRIIGVNLTMDEAINLAGQDSNYVIMPAR